MADCQGRDGTWPCALGLGHPNGEEDHKRFTPDAEDRLSPQMVALLAGVRELRNERDQLLLTCADLLAAAQLTVLHFKRDQASDNFQGDDTHEAWTALSAAIAKAEGR